MVKKIVLLFCLLSLFVLSTYKSVLASEGDPVWAKTVVSGSSDTFFQTVSVSADGSSLTVGTIKGSGTYDFGNGVTVAGAYASNTNALIVKYDKNGLAQWARSVTTGPSTSAYLKALVSSSGNIYAVGTVNGSGTYDFGNGVTVAGAYASNTNALIVKYDKNGLAQWARSTVIGPSTSTFQGMALDSNENIYATGYATGSSLYDFGNGITATSQFSTQNGIVIKYNSSGTALMSTVIPSAPNASNYYTISVDSNGNYYVSGYIKSNSQFDFGNSVTATGSATGGGVSVVVVKYNSSGLAQWAKTSLTNSGSSTFYTSTIDSNGYLVLDGYCGSAVSFGSGILVSGAPSSQNSLIVKYSLDGVPLWARTIVSGSSFSTYQGVVSDRGGNIYATGAVYFNGAYGFGNGVTATGANAGDSNIVLVKYSPDGTPVWAKTAVSATAGSVYRDVGVDYDGNLYAIGYLVGSSSQFNFGSNITLNGVTTYNALMVKYAGPDPVVDTGECSSTCPNLIPDYSHVAVRPVSIVEKNNIISIVSSGVFNYDAYLWNKITPKSGAQQVSKTSYWQVGPLVETWWKSFDNGAKILPSEVQKPYTLIFKYEPSAIEKSISEKSLKLAFSTDGKNWKIISSTLNTTRREIVIVTKNGGYYMIVGGGYTKVPSPLVQGVKTQKIDTQILAPTPVPEIRQPENLNNVPVSKKRCFLFYCW